MERLLHMDRAMARHGVLLLACISLTLLLAACAHTGVSGFDGKWTLITLEGDQQTIELKTVADGEYYLYDGDSHLSGRYAHDGDHLVMQEPNSPRSAGFELTIINDDKMRVVEAPPVRLTGKRYMGAELRRANGPEGG